MVLLCKRRSIAGWSNILNILLNKAELRANIHPLRTRELNKSSVTGQTHRTKLNISKNKGNVESLKNFTEQDSTRVNKAQQGGQINALNILHSTNV